MAKNDQEEAFDRVLTSALARTVDMLKYAEAKNAALLTFSSAWILGSINLLSSGKTLPWGVTPAFIVATPLFALAAVIAIVSFLPRLRTARFFKRPPSDLNLLFFGDVGRLPVTHLRQALLDRYRPEPDRSLTDAYVQDLSDQLGINGQIVTRKHRLFNAGAGVALCAMAIVFFPNLLSLGAMVLKCLHL